MDGPSHYREAERLLESAARNPGAAGELRAAQAQVHATLALAAAAVDTVGSEEGVMGRLTNWREVTR